MVVVPEVGDTTREVYGPSSPSSTSWCVVDVAGADDEVRQDGVRIGKDTFSEWGLRCCHGAHAWGGRLGRCEGALSMGELAAAVGPVSEEG